LANGMMEVTKHGLWLIGAIHQRMTVVCQDMALWGGMQLSERGCCFGLVET
jgi:hypothetical protein